MNISSILITIVGIIFILALYVISRISQSKLPKNQVSLLPNIKDEEGNKFTSILDDIPALDGSTPDAKKAIVENDTEIKPEEIKKIDQTKSSKETVNKTSKQSKQQLILFISAKNNDALDGNLILKSLRDNGLLLGENDIYHFSIENEQRQSVSLFRVANGIEPWTLNDEDLKNKKLAGLSVVMLLPTIIETKTAIKHFLEKADAIAEQVNGVLKNQQQKELSNEEKQAFFNNYNK